MEVLTSFLFRLSRLDFEITYLNRVPFCNFNNSAQNLRVNGGFKLVQFHPYGVELKSPKNCNRYNEYDPNKAWKRGKALCRYIENIDLQQQRLHPEKRRICEEKEGVWV
jgi:hypothetical protein